MTGRVKHVCDELISSATTTRRHDIRQTQVVGAF